MVPPCHSCPGGASVTPAARSTSSRRSRAGAPSCPSRRSPPNSARWARICAATAGLAPADKKLYALRDVTATVESIPLIASSIMSKKIAEGTESLVLNVTTGSGAFMRDPADARRLAETMVEIGTRHGVRTTAVLSWMDRPSAAPSGTRWRWPNPWRPCGWRP
ncbi:MAG: hypothetical protein R2705_16760 [Ilumatobacteraceae bacterium]